jgi:hypothetical protein
MRIVTSLLNYDALGTAEPVTAIGVTAEPLGTSPAA